MVTETPAATKKLKAYQAPHVERLGALSELTLGGSGNETDCNSGEFEFSP